MNLFKKILKRFLAIILVLISLVLSVVVIFAIPISNNYAAMVTNALGQYDSKLDGGSNPQYYKSEFESEEALKKASSDLCLELEQEGMVLLKNEEDTLPLKEGAKISLLGQNSVDLVYGGSGAGSVDTSKADNLKDSMEAAGFEVNQVLWDFYDEGEGSSYRKETLSNFGTGRLYNNEVPRAVYTDKALSSMDEYKDAGIIVIGRSGGETQDLPTDYVKLTQDEIDLVKLATEKFDKVVLVLNVLNPIDLSVLKDYEIDACLWVGAFGQEGVYAVGQALNGTVNPSGHLVDTWAYNTESAPANTNLGDYTITNSEVKAGNKYLAYSEGIYVGYRYYETRYEDVALGNEDANNFNYDKEVAFPFGYGLSYTNFEWSDYQVTENDDSFTFNVTVKNTGEVKGKDTVEIYMQNPYTEYDIANKIEKASVELVGFTKTEELEPGKSQMVTITVDKEEMKTYDTFGEGTYIVEQGDYYFTAAKNSHDAMNNILQTKGKDVVGNDLFINLYNQTQTDTTTYATSDNGTEITNQLESADIRYYDSEFTYLSRNDWIGTWPTTYQNGNWEAPQKLLDALEIMVPEEMTNEMPIFDRVNETYGKLLLADMIGIGFEDPKWDALLGQLSKEELYNLVSRAGYGTAALKSVGLPRTFAKDGPPGISNTIAGGTQQCMAYPPAIVVASTWNVDLAQRRGELVGEDSISTNTSVWYAPAMNIHRSSLSGRNFEYYAEDSFLSGVFGTAEVKGFESKGGVVTIKHFAINDQETNRTGGANFVNEQTARELYLVPFQMCIEDGNANGVMCAMNRIGATWVGGSVGLMTNILKGEWGFKGFAITDQASFSAFSYSDIKEGLAAGNDMWLCTSKSLWKLKDSEMTATLLNNARTAAHRYLYVIANSNAMNGVDADTVVKNVMPLWQKWLIGIVFIVVILDILNFFAFRKLWGSRKFTKKKS